MKQKFCFLLSFLIVFILLTGYAWALPPVRGEMTDYDQASFLVCVDYDTQTMGGSFGMTVPVLKLPMGRLYGYVLGDIGSDIQTLEAKGAYLFDLKLINIFFGVTAGPESDWLLEPGGMSSTAYITGAGGVLLGRAWTNWGLLLHYERVFAMDGKSRIPTLTSIKLGFYLNIF